LTQNRLFRRRSS